MNAHVLVLMPTYNEALALETTVRRLFEADPAVSLLVIDDASPDGTGAIADELASADDRIDVLHRQSKDGLGAAYLAGMRVALDRGADLIVEIDADGSHPPEALPRLIAEADRAALVLGSRWVPGGRVRNWPLRREFVSRFANLYARVLLGIGVQDMTAGFRVYRADALATLDLDSVTAQGYCFQIDMTRRIFDEGWPIVEVPIEFRERELGVSKMTTGVIAEAVVKVAGWGVGRRAAAVVTTVRGRQIAARRTPTRL